MKPWLIPVSLLALSAVGFGIAKIATSKKDEPHKVVGGVDYRGAIYLADARQWYAQVFIDGKPGQTLGPLPDAASAAAELARFMSGLDVVAFYTVHSTGDTAETSQWFFDGWSRGEKVVADSGPYASSAAAMTAGSAWAASAAGGVEA